MVDYDLLHDGEDIDDTIDEVVAARGDSASLSARLASIVSDFETDQQRQETEIGAVAAQGAKNLCPYNSFTATASGTVVNDQPINLLAGTYILSFKHTTTTGSTAFRFLKDGTSVEALTVNNSTTGAESRTFTLSSEVNQIRVFTSIANEYTEVMIRRAEITDSTYAPYAPTNRELYEMLLALQSSQSVQSSAASLMQAGRIDAAEMTAAEPAAAETGEETDA